MTRQIPKIFINDLLAQTDIVELIKIRVKLEQRGKNFYAYCPFHHEKTPSFTVNKEKQFFYCFGCGIHGNAIDFLINYDQLNFIESIEELAVQNNLEVPYITCYSITQEKNYLRKKLYHLMTQLNLLYHNILNAETSISACDYLKQRGLNKSIITSFSIGFAPPKWDTVIRHFEQQDTNINILLKDIGMLVINNNHTYDRFRNRIMFPIRDIHGRVIAFGGRLIDNGTPKYINSPETDIYHKGHQVYGLFEAQQYNKVLPVILLVEGYMDVISLAQFGINYAVAILGTSITKYHIQLLYQKTDHIICCYDGDDAGYKAAWCTLKSMLPYLTDNKQLSFISLPNGEDPDSLIRRIGKDSFEIYIKQAIPLSTFLFNTLIKQIDFTNPDSRPKLGMLTLPLIDKIPGKILRLYLRQQLGIKLGILDDNKLEKLLPSKSIKIDNLSPIKTKYTIMRILIGLLIQHPWLSSLVPKEHKLDKLKLPGITLFIDIVKTCQNGSNLTTAQLLEYYRGNKFYSQLETLVIWNHMIVEEVIEATFVDILSYLNNLLLKYRQEDLIAYDRLYGLNLSGRQELWSLNKILSKNK